MKIFKYDISHKAVETILEKKTKIVLVRKGAKVGENKVKIFHHEEEEHFFAPHIISKKFTNPRDGLTYTVYCIAEAKKTPLDTREKRVVKDYFREMEYDIEEEKNQEEIEEINDNTTT